MSVRIGFAVLVGFLLALGPGAASADDRVSLDAGRTAGRGLLILRDPAVCGIALVRERCKADVEAFLNGRADADFKGMPRIGAHPASGLRAFVATGDRDKFDRALGYVNTKQSTPAMWTADARMAALYDAGVEAVFLHAANGNSVAVLLGSGPASDLIAHAAQVPPGSLPVAVPPSIPPGMMQFARNLVDAVESTMPAPSFASMTFADGPAGDAALGVAGSTVSELIDCEPWLFQPESQRFVDGWTTRLTAFAPSHAAEIDAFRAAVRPGPRFSHDAAIRTFNHLISSVLDDDRSRAAQFMLGAFAAQLVFNSAVMRDHNVATMMSSVIAANTALDASVPGWRAARGTINDPTGTSWFTQYQNGVLLVDLIEKANRQ